MTLHEATEGVYVHESEFIQSNAVVVQGPSGVLVVDPGITTAELAGLAGTIREARRSVVAGFATHPDWDHVLWHADLGDAPRYGTALAAASMAELLARDDWRSLVTEVLPPEHAEDIPLDELFGRITALPADARELPWDGPAVRIIEHRAHASGHAALLLPERRVLIAGDMLSDILIPFLDLEAEDPVGDYLAAVDLIDAVAEGVDIVIPGHGSVGDARDLRERIELDRAYALALRDGRIPDDPRVGPTATFGEEWLPSIHEWQAEQILQKQRDAQEARA